MSTPYQTGHPGGTEARTEPRANVVWRGRVTLPSGRTVDVRLRDISNSGAGFLSPDSVPLLVPLTLTMEVPKPDDLSQSYLVTTQFMAANVVLRGHDYRVGATWALEPAVRELIKHWIFKILHG